MGDTMQMDGSSLQNLWPDNAFHNIRQAYEMSHQTEQNGQVTELQGVQDFGGQGGGAYNTTIVHTLCNAVVVTCGHGQLSLAYNSSGYAGWVASCAVANVQGNGASKKFVWGWGLIRRARIMMGCLTLLFIKFTITFKKQAWLFGGFCLHIPCKCSQSGCFF